MKKKEWRGQKMINVAICDDDISVAGRIERMLQNIAKRNFIDIDTEVFWNGKQLVELVEDRTYFDIIFLDIEMGKEDGITVARRIRRTDRKTLIVYVTSHENYMKESFSVRPFQFLVKPVSESQMEICFKEAYEEINSEDSYFRYSYQRVSHKIPICYGKLNDIEKSLKKSKVAFLRVHQSFLVNYKHVDELGYDFVVLDNGKQISISEDRRKNISQEYCAMEDTFYVGK